MKIRNIILHILEKKFMLIKQHIKSLKSSNMQLIPVGWRTKKYFFIQNLLSTSHAAIT